MIAEDYATIFAILLALFTIGCLICIFAYGPMDLQYTHIESFVFLINSLAFKIVAPIVYLAGIAAYYSLASERWRNYYPDYIPDSILDFMLEPPWLGIGLFCWPLLFILFLLYEVYVLAQCLFDWFKVCFIPKPPIYLPTTQEESTEYFYIPPQDLNELERRTLLLQAFETELNDREHELKQRENIVIRRESKLATNIVDNNKALKIEL